MTKHLKSYRLPIVSFVLVVISFGLTGTAIAQTNSKVPTAMESEIKQLCKDSRQGSPQERLRAVMKLQSYGPDAKAGESCLIDALNSNSGDPIIQNLIRMAAAVALRDFEDKASPDTVQPLIDSLKDIDYSLKDLDYAYVQANLADALGHIAPNTDEELHLREAATNALVPFLDARNSNPHVKGTVAFALYYIWNYSNRSPQISPEVVTELKSMLYKDSEPEISIRTNAAAALGALGVAKQAQGDLIEALRDDPLVQEWAIYALGRTESVPAETWPLLKKVVDENKDKDGKCKNKNLCRNAADAFANLKSLEAVEILTGLLTDDDDQTRQKAAAALDNLASGKSGLVEAKRTDAIKPLAAALSVLQKSGDPNVSVHAYRVQESIDQLTRQAWENRFRRYKWYLLGPAAYLVLLAVCLGLLWFYPLGLLRVNDALSGTLDVKLPTWLGGFTIPLRYALLFGFFHYHSRVLDAWVFQNLDEARKQFGRLPTVEAQEIHIPVPVILDKKTIVNLCADDLRAIFTENISCLLVYGEGGSGKTNLVCRLSCWAMSRNKQEWLHPRHPMLPILIEPGTDVPVDDEHFARIVNEQLRRLTVRSAAPAKELVRRLLLERRVMLIIDSFSEMPESARMGYLSGIASIPANAVIFTSRSPESISGLPMTAIQPLRINGKQLSSFMDAYLVHRGKRDLFDDKEFFDYCGRLSLIVGDRDLTVLLAKCYGDQMIAAKDGTYDRELAQNIPDLMVDYIYTLYRNPSGAPEYAELVRGAEMVAWGCLKTTLTPMPGDRDEILAALGNPERSRAIIDYLENVLKITKTAGALRNQIRFVFDPLSEYLAGLHLVEQYANDVERWRKFLEDADKKVGAPKSIRSFLLALRDCCLSKGTKFGVPSTVPEEIAKRITSVVV